jgi:AmiR/NasT family two-component response regulator
MIFKKIRDLEKRVAALEKQLQEQPKVERVRGAKTLKDDPFESVRKRALTKYQSSHELTHS